jgi:hypothetical protein
MGTSLKLRRNDRTDDRTAKCSLILRSHDLGGTDYEHLATLTLEQGISLSMGERAINWLHDAPYHREQQAGKVLVKLRRDAEPGQALWDLQLARENGKTEHMCFINSGKADTLLFEMGKDAFEDCDESWREHSRMCRRFKVRELREEADRIEAGIEAEEAENSSETPEIA